MVDKDMIKKNTIDLNQSQSSLNILNSSTTSFYNQSKNSSFENYMNVMKSDICQIQERINHESHILSLMSITFSGVVKKKAKEIEESKKEGIKSILDKINYEVSTTKTLSLTYKTTSKTELIQKLYSEVLHLELLIKKLNEFCLINMINIKGDESIIDSISNIDLVLELIEKMKDMIFSKKNDEFIDKNILDNKYLNKEIIEKNKEDKVLGEKMSNSNSEIEYLMNCKSLEDIFSKKDSKLGTHLENLFIKYKEDINQKIITTFSQDKLIPSNYVEINKKIDIPSISKFIKESHTSIISKLELEIENLKSTSRNIFTTNVVINNPQVSDNSNVYDSIKNLDSETSKIKALVNLLNECKTIKF